MHTPSSLFVPVVTPLNADLSIDHALLASFGAHLLESGADKLVLFGTLGEGQSFSASERMAALETVLGAGWAPENVVVGIGAAAYSDVAALSTHAQAQGCQRQLLLPPFFFRGIDDDGLVAFFDAALKRVPKDISVILYDIPGVVGVAIAPTVISRLVAAHGSVVGGLKDSVGQWDHVRTSLETFPNLDVYCGNEVFLPDALALGSAGAISGLGNIAPKPMAAIAKGQSGADSPQFVAMSTLYHAIAAHPVIPTVKALAARRWDLPALARTRPPLSTARPQTDAALMKALDAFARDA